MKTEDQVLLPCFDRWLLVEVFTMLFKYVVSSQIKSYSELCLIFLFVFSFKNILQIL